LNNGNFHAGRGWNAIARTTTPRVARAYRSPANATRERGNYDRSGAWRQGADNGTHAPHRISLSLPLTLTVMRMSLIDSVQSVSFL